MLSLKWMPEIYSFPLTDAQQLSPLPSHLLSLSLLFSSLPPSTSVLLFFSSLSCLSHPGLLCCSSISFHASVNCLSVSLRSSATSTVSTLLLFGVDTVEEAPLTFVTTGRGVTTSRLDEAKRTGGVTDGLAPSASSIREYHFQEAAVTPPPSVLTPVRGFLSSCG